MQMNYNGYNTYEKRGLGSVNIGRYTGPSCNENCEEERSFWKKLKDDFSGIICVINKLMRLHHVSYQGISDIMALIYPLGRDTSFNAFADSVEKTVIPPAEDIRIVLYGEQHPKKGRTQKFRLTLLDGVTGQPIAEELYDRKDPTTIMAFLVKYLDPSKRTFVVYFVKGAPATNNGVENYYSTSLKTHRKKQLRSDGGIENQMKLSAMKRAGLLGRCKKTLLEAFLMFVPFLNHG
jgi:hypothetical protein